jgi:hypothetical protein
MRGVPRARRASSELRGVLDGHLEDARAAAYDRRELVLGLVVVEAALDAEAREQAAP